MHYPEWIAVGKPVLLPRDYARQDNSTWLVRRGEVGIIQALDGAIALVEWETPLRRVKVPIQMLVPATFDANRPGRKS